MTVLADHMARRVSIAVFRIVVGTLNEQGLKNLSIATDASNVQRRPQVLGLAIKVGAELSKNLNHFDVTFIAGNVEGRPAIRVTLIKECLRQFRVLLDEQLVARLESSLLRENPNVSQQTPLLLLILLALRLHARRSLLYLLLYKLRK